MKNNILIAFLAACTLSAAAQETKKSDHLQIHGTIRTKYEYEPPIDKGRFEVRNARISVEGKVNSLISGYKAEIDLSDEGNIRMLDAYARLQPQKTLEFTLGQMRVPFSIDAHRSPHLQYFANRSFIAKQVGDVRDVGAAVRWSFAKEVPLILEGGIFNGSGLTNQKHYWTSDYNFSFKAQALFLNKLNLTLSCQKAHAGDVNTYLYDVGIYLQTKRWHVEAEYLRKHYTRHAFIPVNAINAFAVYRVPLTHHLSAISFLGRYDYMSNHSKGIRNEEGILGIDDPERHRLTAGMTLSFGGKALQADIRLNYEQYFYRSGITPAISEQNKAVTELVVYF